MIVSSNRSLQFMRRRDKNYSSRNVPLLDILVSTILDCLNCV
jgi:hypothetical protein